MPNNTKQDRAMPGTTHVWAPAAANEVGQIFDQLGVSERLLARIRSTAQSVDHKKGFVAEVIHCEGLNLDAIIKEKNVRAFCDRHPNTPVANCDPVADIIITGGENGTHRAQLKYYKTGDDTQKALRVIKDGEIKYAEADSFIVPSDQLHEVRATAHKDWRENAQKRPQVAEAAKIVKEKADDRLRVNGVESTPLTEGDSKAIAKGGEKGDAILRQRREDVLEQSTAKQGLNAAKSAAIATAVISGTINSFTYLNEVQSGRMTGAEAAKRILIDTSIAAADAALKAGAATAAVSCTARTLPSIFAGSAFSSAMASGAIAGAAVCAVDLVECIVLYCCGKMTAEELEIRAGTNIFQTGAGVVGSTIGGVIGAVGGPPGVLIGSFIGGMITSLAMTVAIDGHIEGPFKAALGNTETLVRAQFSMSQSIALLVAAQELNAQFVPYILESERQFDKKMAQVDWQNNEIASLLREL